MTPIGLRLQLELDEEVLRMANEWFFKWHFIGKDGPVEIESFRGKPINYGGIKFDGSAHQVYWDTIQFYLRKKVSALFDQLEINIKDYPVQTRGTSIEEAQTLIGSFTARIRRMAIEKDRILRGDGVNFPQKHDFGRWEGSGLQDIAARAEGLRAIYCEERKTNKSVWETANDICDNHRWWIITGGLVLTIISIILAI